MLSGASSSVYDLGKRRHTMETALRMLTERKGRTIVETGCAHSPGDWSGAGLSTIVFADWAMQHGGDLASIDIDPDHIQACEWLLAGKTHFGLYLSDSVRWLTRSTWTIDLLYLDSMDYPYGTLLDMYGGKSDLNAAIAMLASIPEDVIVENYGHVIGPSQRHAAAEMEAALPHLHHESLVLIDDAGLPGGGKARLARKVLDEAGWVCLLDEYQTLWARP